MIEITLGDTYFEKEFFNVPLYISNKLFNCTNGECEVKIKEKKLNVNIELQIKMVKLEYSEENY